MLYSIEACTKCVCHTKNMHCSCVCFKSTHMNNTCIARIFGFCGALHLAPTGAGELLVDSGWCRCQSEVVGHIWRPSQRSQVPINRSRFQNWVCSSRFAYGRSDVVLMCFDIGRAQSLENCRWLEMKLSRCLLFNASVSGRCGTSRSGSSVPR